MVDMTGIDALLRNKKVIVMVGAGGVGKTTTSALLAIRAAMSGRRVALLSIDPAKRLANALGLGLGHEMSAVALQNPVPGGSLHAAMLKGFFMAELDVGTRPKPLN